MSIATNNMTAAEITANLTTLQSRMQFNYPEIYINGATAFLTAFTPANLAQFTFNTITPTQLVVTQNSTGIVWTVNGTGFNPANPFLSGTRTSETFQFPADHVTLTSTPRLETGNFTFTITDTDLIGASVRVVVNNFVATRSTLTDAGIVGVLQGAFSPDGNGTSTALSLTNGTKVLSISGFSFVNNTVGPVGIVGPLFISAALAGNDTVTITGTVGIDLFGFAGNDSMIGGVGNDTLYGGLGNDSLNGGVGNDSMEGGNGNDIYFVNTGLDITTETNADSVTGGVDEVRSSVSHILSDNLENLTLTGTLAISGTGNVLNNNIVGNAVANTLNGLGGDDTLNGGIGNDSMSGGDGNDIYIVDAALDSAIETNADSVTGGDDEVRSSVTRTLGDNLEDLTLTGIAAINGLGNVLNNTITGNGSANILNGLDGNDNINGGAGADTLNGGNGDDILTGGDGNDTYIIDNNIEIIIETNTALAGGIDTVLSSDDFDADSSANRAGIENITLTGAIASLAIGNALNNVITGNALANNLIGNDGNDTLIGNAGDDSLNGGAGNDAMAGGLGGDSLVGGTGNDSMNGGLGSDTYFVDSVLDVLTEGATNALGGGIDIVETSVSRSLGLNFDNLTLTGAANINGTGNELANIVIGNSGNNILIGGLGADTLNGGDGNDSLNGGVGADSLTGGNGNDIYFVNSLLDITIETNIDSVTGGDDEVRSNVSHILKDNIEKLSLLAVSIDPLTLALNNINGIGNGLANTLTGNGGNNILNGLDGADALNGGLGNDTLNGGAGADSLLGGAGNDSLDGGVGADTMEGGVGNDIYVVDEAGKTIIESLTLAQFGGIDLVKSSLSFTLGDNMDNLALTGTAAVGTGNVLNNTIIGNASNNSLVGDAGNDILLGGAGVDTLNGGLGNDRMNGGLGNDTYIVDSILDVLTEGATFALGGGTDTVQSTVTRTLGLNFDNLTLQTASTDPLTLALNNINAIGNELANVLTGNNGNNRLAGGLGNDLLIGSAGNDTLNGGLGDDTLNGGLGDDTYIININSTAARVEADSGGIDTTILIGAIAIPNYITYRLDLGPSTIENLDISATGSTKLIAIGNILANKITGNAAANGIDGGAGNDWLIGGAGNDQLLGGTGNDSLDGGVGGDAMLGEDGDDIYIVDSLSDIITETNALAAGGIDIVRSSVSRTLGNNFENLSLVTVSINPLTLALNNINGTGNALNNILTGNVGNNILNGGLGADTLNGDLGSDTLNGGIGTDTMTGGAGNDSLDGGTGADTMEGGTGNDIYVVDDAGDIVIETLSIAPLGGIDTVKSTISYSLLDTDGVGSSGGNVENLTLLTVSTTNLTLNNIDGTGNVFNNIIIGNAGNNNLIGNDGNDILAGGAGVDILNGGAGNDSMNGGLGSDTYFVDSILDVLTEGATNLLGGGIDLVEASVSRTLGANFDNLTLTGAGDINAIGNELANILIGNAGNNLLAGGLGADTLQGGAGNDTLNGGVGNDSMSGGVGDDIYFVNSLLDITIETNTGGNDEVRSNVSHILKDNIEKLTLLTVSIDPLTLALNNINGTGNGLANTLTGNGGNNILSGLDGADALNGGAGNDVLIGGQGADVLTGGLGADRFDFNSNTESAGVNIDTIADFSRLQLDKIDLSTIDAKAGTPLINDAFIFIVNAAFSNTAGELRFDTTTSIVSGDIDGNGAADFEIQLTGVTTNLLASDFIL